MGVTPNGLQAFDCFRLEACLGVRERPANEPASSVGDLGQPCLVLFFELLKGTLFTRTKHNQELFGVIPFIKLQNDT